MSSSHLCRIAAASALAWLLLSPTASAEPASSAFLAAWQQSDEALAVWDVKAAEAAIDPLLAGSVTLDPQQRFWFDYSAARALTYAGRRAEARLYAQRAADLSRDSMPEELELDESLPQFKGKFCLPGPSSAGSAGGAIADLLRGDVTFLDTGSRAWRGPSFPLKQGLLIATYFPRLVPVQKPRYYACYAAAVQRPGGATGIQQGTSKSVVTVPSKQRVVAKHRLGPREPFTAQVFGQPDGARLTVTWTQYPSKRKMRTKISVKDHEAQVRAPGARGSYDLQLGVGSARDFATGITSITVR